MTINADKKSELKRRLREEMINYAIVSAYLFVCFSCLFLYKIALLSDGSGGVEALPFGIALGKALILGKFFLIGEGVGIGSRVDARTLLHRIAIKSFMFLLLLAALTGVEELILGWVHGHTMAETFSEFGAQGIYKLLSTTLMMFLVLIPLISFKEISEDLGPGVLHDLLFRSKDKEL